MELSVGQIVEGKITGIGTHEYLLENNETYQEIYYSQMDKKEETK